jgi:Transcription factor WhiB
MTWRSKAACAKADPNLFFPEEPTLAHLVAVKKKYCDVCPVRLECTQEALSDHASVGIHGGFQFPIVSQRTYEMELMRIQGAGWQEIGDLYGMTRSAANALVGRAFERAGINCTNGVQYLGRGAPVNSEPLPGLKVGPSLGEAQDALTDGIIREREAGRSFTEVGEIFGITMVAAGQRYRRAIARRKAA